MPGLADVTDILVSIVIAVGGFAVVIAVCVGLLVAFSRVLPAPADPERHLRGRSPDPADEEQPPEEP